jgi:[ribosomal protein S5]-alanine N-acetyltransferase
VVLSGTTPSGTEVELGALRRRDADEWTTLRRRNRLWLSEWEATSPLGELNTVRFGAMVRQYNREGRAGRMLPFAIRSEGRLVGQLHLFGISWGSLLSVAAGYWVDQDRAGHGIAPTSLALAGDHALGEMGLHRIEVNIRPENANSLAVVRKLGFRDEGVRRHYLHINGAWRDHRTFALTVEDLSGKTLMERLHSDHTSHIGDTPPQIPRAGAPGT